VTCIDEGSEAEAVAVVFCPVGAGCAVTEFEGADAGPVPTLLVAVTVKLYEVPLVKPVTVIGGAVPLAVRPPGEEVTVYPVIGAPPVKEGAVKATVACVSPGVALIAVAGSGTVATMENERETVGAGAKVALPAWSA
jgi:hypothetical protein